MSQATNDSENPYAAPRSAALSPFAAMPGNAEEQELRAFVGPRADNYLRRWAPLLQGTGSSDGFNWPAFLFSGIWLPYRKMYAAAMIFYGLVLASSVVEELYFPVVMHRETPAALDRILGLAMAAVCGMFANRWYLLRAKRVIAEARASGYRGDALLQTVAQRGGTNLLAGFGMFILFVAVTGVVYVMLDALLSASVDQP
jgi:hypothetical protein